MRGEVSTTKVSCDSLAIAVGDCQFAWCSRWNRLRANGSPRPYRERGRVRVLLQARTPLTLVLSPQIRGEARKVSVISFNSRN
jgi:hypothetical protein